MKLFSHYLTFFWAWRHWYFERARHMHETIWRIGPLRIRILR